ncbi:MAG: type 4a pilus biogenesis protein PilO [Armatimonadetes bacterium]|nr:type 4a pilus biogenesis protein PilO [Armatimonadota bacterium]
MNQSKRSTYSIAAIILGAVVAVLLAAVVAQQVTASRLGREIRAQNQVLADARRNLENRRKWSSEYDEFSLRLGGRMSTCSWSDQMPYMMAQVNGIVQANGLKAENIQPEPMVVNWNIRKFPMRVALQTDLRRLTEVLRDVRNSRPLLDVERLEVRQAQDGDSGLQINMTVASFVVLDQNAPVVRRRASLPVKKTERFAAKPETTEPDKPEAANQQAKGSVAPVARPAARSASSPPEARSPVRPMAKPDRSERPRSEETTSTRPEKPARAKNGKSDAGEVRTGSRAAPSSDGMDAQTMGIRRAPKEAGGGAK